ncbi:MAG: hypothetical protein J6B07_02120 [Opitutales bacterium]|nr:hypothetical protein [Opitutales bacterium]
MEELIQRKNDILARISDVVEKVEKVDDETSLSNRQQIVLILSNMSSTLEKCDENYLLKQLLDHISTNLSSIENYVNQKQYKSTQNYLAEIVKDIAFLNNANGKESLRGYQSAVNKNIRLLEQEIQKSVNRLESLEMLISEKSKSFSNVETEVQEKIEKYKAEHEKELATLNEKYEKFVSELSKKQEDSQKSILEDQQKFKKEYNDEIIKIKAEISETKTTFQNDSSTSLANFDAEKTKKIEELDKQVLDFINQTDEKLEELKASATEKIGYVASATYSNIYQTYSDQSRKASHWWYAATLISLVCLIVLSICWFVIKEYNNTDYVLLIARICASVGFAVVSRYSAIQASKNKVMETKLRKIQLQMATFDAFVASLDKEEQDKLKIELTHKLIEQEDWLVHDKNEIDTIKDVVKLLEKSGYKVDLKKPE